MSRVHSQDGTPIAFERLGEGPPVILVDGAFCSRAFGPMPKLARLLATQFTVYVYDRRGRGRSGDTQPYRVEREQEDLAALIREAGGSASLLGLSSGAALALEAAAAGLNVRKVAAYEPPYVYEGAGAPVDHDPPIRRLLSQGDRGGAVKYFMRDMVGAPAPMVFLMQSMPWVWSKLKAVAHTLPYDVAVMNGFAIPRARFAAIAVPTLAMHGEKTPPPLQRAARAVADAVPHAFHRALPGQGHNVNLKVLAPVVMEFFNAPAR